MIVLFEEGNLKLKEGEFENAKKVFSELLDENPENLEYISGYYISSYWDNRLDSILATREGKDRGNKLVSMFNEFVNELTNRKYPKNNSYESVTQCILGEASTQFRLAYQKEGMIGMDREVLATLSMCLIRIGDYRNALDIIEYSRKYSDTTNQQLYYLAECYYHLGQQEKSEIYYRMAFINDPDLFNFDLVKSEPLLTAISELEETIPSKDKLREALPVYCLEKNYFSKLKDYTRDEVTDLFQEMVRLEPNLANERPDVQFKVQCRILQIGMTILDTFHAQINPELSKKVKNKIYSIDPNILERRIENKKKGSEE